MSKISTLLYGLGIGAGLMYFYDPSRGNQRRSMVAQQAQGALNNTKDGLNAAVVDLQNRGQGLVHKVRSTSQKAQNQNGQQGKDLMGKKSPLTPGIRLLMGLGGASMALYGRNRGGLLGAILGLTGLGMLARGVTNMPARTMMGIGRHPGAFDVQKEINIDVPVEQVYKFWSHFENFPQFMEHVKEVQFLGNNRYHWVVQGPAGINAEWDAVVTQEVPNQLIAWQSLPGSTVKNFGKVTFRQNDQGGTRINVRLSYTPPAGIAGGAVASLLGADPKTEMDEDLARLKTLFEQGQTHVKGQKLTRSDLPDTSTAA